MNYELLAWIGTGVLGLVHFLFLVAWAAPVPSRRLSPAERRARLGRRDLQRMKKLKAPLIRGRAGSWNALVDRDDRARLRVIIVGRRRRRWLMIEAFVVGGLLSVSSVVTAVRLTDGASRVDELPGASQLMVAGFMFIAIYGWYATAGVTAWATSAIMRSRMPMAWRLLDRGAAISQLQDGKYNRWNASEAPRRGMITTAHARRLLRIVEAEILESTRRPHVGDTLDHVEWRTATAPRVSLVLSAKAQLLDQPTGEVSVDAIFDWFDRVAGELVDHRTRLQKLARLTPAPELLDVASVKRVRITLGLGFWRSSAGLTSVVLGVCALAVVTGAAYPVLRDVFGPYPELATILGTVVGAPLVAQVIAVGINKVMRER